MIASTKVPAHHRKSPRAVLEQYVGFPGEIDAPDWVQWNKSTLDFYQPRVVLAETFVQLSTLKENLRLVSLTIEETSWQMNLDDIGSLAIRSVWWNGPRQYLLVS
jgi:hypothetical protein